jgi:predicted HicB family RNase H-like nuclease
MKQLTVRLPDELHELLYGLFIEERVSVNSLIIKAFKPIKGD